MTPRMQRAVRAAFWQRYVPCLRRGWFDHLAGWLAVPRRHQDPDDFSHWLARIAAYQQIAGQQATVPKSLRKLLGGRERRQREREHLRARLAAGTLDPAARGRLNALECDAAPRPDAAKFRRAAEEVYLLLGIDALGVVAGRLAAAKCRRHLGDLAGLLTTAQHWHFALWLENLTPSQGKLLREMIAARDCHGREYKRHLTENQAWISRARARGIDLGQWFAAEPRAEIVSGQTVEIGLAGDLHDVFLMGSYFHTCLGIGQCNELSVLTNAYDANKQVVFMFTADEAGCRQVVARQLIAISSDFKLLGYCCYLHSRYADKLERQAATSAMASYCGRLAARCGLELANEGFPEQIREHFWYDDGPWQWSAAAQAAWTRDCQGTELLATMV